MKITVCIGSSCHLKGSRQIVEKLQKLVSEHALKNEIELAGTFCMGQCQKGVCVDLDGTIHSVSPETVEKFFNEEVRTKV